MVNERARLERRASACVRACVRAGSEWLNVILIYLDRTFIESPLRRARARRRRAPVYRIIHQQRCLSGKWAAGSRRSCCIQIILGDFASFWVCFEPLDLYLAPTATPQQDPGPESGCPCGAPGTVMCCLGLQCSMGLKSSLPSFYCPVPPLMWHQNTIRGTCDAAPEDIHKVLSLRRL